MTQKTKYIKVSTGGAIFYSLLLALATFYSGVSWVKSKSGAAPASTPTTSPGSTNNAATLDVAKSDRPELKFFVMSFCPYGNQMEEILRPVFDLIGSKANIQPQYIFEKISDLKPFCQGRSGDTSKCAAYIQNKYFKDEAECKKVIGENYNKCLDEKQYLKAGNSFYASLHGRVEANQDVREICAWNLTTDKKPWWNFIANVNKNCNTQNADTCWEEQAKNAGLDTNKIADCFSKQAVELIEKEIAQTDKFKVSGSPTLLINDILFPPQSAYAQDGNGSFKIGNKVITQNQYRTPNGIKDVVCASSKNPPKECNQTLANLAGNNAPAAGGCN